MLYHSFQHVCYCFNAAVRMPRKTRNIIPRVVRMKMIKKKERVRDIGAGKPDRPFKMHPCALKGGTRLNDHPFLSMARDDIAVSFSMTFPPRLNIKILFI